MIILKSPAEIAYMKAAGDAVARCVNVGHNFINEWLEKGNEVTKLDVERVVAHCLHEECKMEPAFLNFRGYPYTSCISVNEEIVHGLPNETLIQDGDLVTIDFGAKYRDYNADAALTKIVGTYDEDSTRIKEAKRLIQYCNDALNAGVDACRIGNMFGDVTRAIYQTALPSQYGIVNAYTGHGIGKEMHEEPHIYNAYPTPPGYEETKIRKGMTLCIEPMLTLSQTSETVTLEDKWTIVTTDGRLATHSEVMLAVTDGDPLILCDPRSK